MSAYMFILSSRFRPSLTGLAAHSRQECRALAEMTQNIEVDLVLMYVAATSEQQLVKLVFSHFAYSDTAVQLKCIWHPKNASTLLNSLVQFFRTSQQCEQWIFSMAYPNKVANQCMFFVMVIINCSREITLRTSAIDVYKCRKTISVCCIKMRGAGGGGGEMEEETDLKLEETLQSPWTPCRTCSQQVAYSWPPCLHDKSPICRWCKEQVCCLSMKKPNTDKLCGQLGGTSGMEPSSF